MFGFKFSVAFGSYNKGARAERELISFFDSRGYSVIRAAGSGSSGLSPDILVFRQARWYAFECKSVDSTRLYIEESQFQGLLKWKENSGISDVFVAWRIPSLGFRFLRLEEFEKSGKSFSISKESALLIDRKLEDLVK